MEYSWTVLADYDCHTGEGPLFHPDENAVYWTDIPNGRLFRYDLATEEHHPIETGRQVGGFTLQTDGRLLLFLDKGSIALFREGEPLEYIVEEIPTEVETRFNDVIADPEGRVFCGTMPTKDRLGNFYRLDTDGTLTHLLSDIGCSNGMGFTPNLSQMYYTDTGARNIYRFDYDRATGALTNQITLIHVDEDGGGFPDGMTVDTEGYLWSTRWDGGCVVRYSPEGVEVDRVSLPVAKVSCALFGGENYETMFVTTAGGYNREHTNDLDGALFALQLPGIKGVPEFRSKVRV